VHGPRLFWLISYARREPYGFGEERSEIRAVGSQPRLISTMLLIIYAMPGLGGPSMPTMQSC
jgi:hypothetical protein